jgi:hypothetical protein
MKFLLICFAALHSFVLGEEYGLRFDRSQRVGARFRVEGHLLRKDQVSKRVGVGKVQTWKSNADVQFSYDVEVLEVSATGEVTGQRVKITKLEGTTDGKAVDHFKAGDQIVVIRTTPNERKVTINGLTASPPQVEFVREMCDVSSALPTTRDHVFGTEKKITVGDQWKVNQDAVRRQSFEFSSEALNADEIEGNVQFSGLSRIGGRACLRIAGRLVMKCGQRPARGFPPGVRMLKELLETEISGDFPVDTTDPLVPAEITVTRVVSQAGGEIEMDGQKQPIELSVNNHFTRSVRRFPVE